MKMLRGSSDRMRLLRLLVTISACVVLTFWSIDQGLGMHYLYPGLLSIALLAGITALALELLVRRRQGQLRWWTGFYVTAGTAAALLLVGAFWGASWAVIALLGLKGESTLGALLPGALLATLLVLLLLPMGVHRVLKRVCRAVDRLESLLASLNTVLVMLLAWSLLAVGSHLASQWREGYTPLIWAAEGGYVQIALLLIDRSGAVDARTRGGKSALMAAIARYPVSRPRADRHPLVRRMLDVGADPNLRDASGSTALLTAVRYQDAEVVQMLLAAGADPDLRDNLGRSALMWAIETLDPLALAEPLLAAGADPNATDAEGRTVLMHVARQPFYRNAQKQTRLISILLASGAGVHARDKKRRTVLHWACEGRNPELIRRLIGADTDVNAADESGRTPLISLLETPTYGRQSPGRTEITQLLLQAGTDVNASERP